MSKLNHIVVFSALSATNCLGSLPGIGNASEDGAQPPAATEEPTPADDEAPDDDDDDDEDDDDDDADDDDHDADDDDDDDDDGQDQGDQDEPCIAIDQVRQPLLVRSSGLRLGFRVLDCAGNALPELTNDMVTVVDERTGHAMASVSELVRPDDYRLSTIIAIDLSDDAHQADLVTAAIEGALGYLDALATTPAAAVEHEVAVVAFGHTDAFEIVADFDLDLASARSAVERLAGREPKGETDLYGAYVRSLEVLAARGDGFDVSERFLVFVGGSGHSVGDTQAGRMAALTARSTANTHVYGLALPGIAEPTVVTELASTPENSFVVADHDAVAPAFVGVAQRVGAVSRSNVVVGACTDRDQGSHAVVVRVATHDAEDAVTMDYDADELDGDIASCDVDAIASGRLDCSPSACDVVCQAMACGCDGTIQCGTCGLDSVCSENFQCVAGEGIGAGDLTCSVGDEARDIRLGVVEANQGVGVELARGYDVVAVEDRNAPLVEGRELLVRAGWTLESEWTPRTILARLRIEHADGSVEFEDRRYITAASEFDALESSFAWLIPAPYVRAGTSYAVSFHETEGEMLSAPLPAAPPRVPAAGSTDLGVVAGDRRIAVTLVPITHTDRHCTLTGDPQAVIDEYADHLYATYPVSDVQIDVRDEPVAYDGELDMDGWVNLLAEVSVVRALDGAGEHVYYFGVIEPCSDTHGVTGIGYVPSKPTKKSSSRYRTGAGVSSKWTFAHEIGHNHGRHHVACTGTESNPDDEYPHAHGETGAWGFDLSTRELRDPEHTSFMSYCSADWVSDYGWSWAREVIDAIATWSTAGPVPVAGRTDVLVTAISNSGSTRSWIERGVAPPSDDGHTVDVWMGDEHRARVPAEYTEISEGGGMVVVTELRPLLGGATHLGVDVQAIDVARMRWPLAASGRAKVAIESPSSVGFR